MADETVGWIFNGLFAILGFAGAFAVNRLAKAVDGLVKADGDILKIVMEHREDILKNYATSMSLLHLKNDFQQQGLEHKKDIIGRVDRLETTFKDALMAHEHRESQLYNRNMREPT